MEIERFFYDLDFDLKLNLTNYVLDKKITNFHTLLNSLNLVSKYFNSITLGKNIIKHLALRNVGDETQYENALKVMKRSKSLKVFGIIDCSPKFASTLIEEVVTNHPKLQSLTISNKLSFPNSTIMLPEFPSTIKVIRTLKHLHTLEINNVYIGQDSQREITEFKTLKSFKMKYNYHSRDQWRTHFSTPNFFKTLGNNSKQLKTIELREHGNFGIFHNEVSS